MSIVYFFDKHFLDNVELSLKELGIERNIRKGDKVAIKLHMGEYGNLNYVRPPIVERVVRLLKDLKAKPFLFDTPTMYKGSRFTVEGYYETARRNGFSEETMGCPIIISDEGVEVEIDGVCLKRVEVAKKLHEADVLVAISHAKGHAMTGFGGAIKNLGMGGLTRKGKADVHKSDLLQALAEAAYAVLKKFKDNKFFLNVLMDISPLCDCFLLGGKVQVFPFAKT